MRDLPPPISSQKSNLLCVTLCATVTGSDNRVSTALAANAAVDIAVQFHSGNDLNGFSVAQRLTIQFGCVEATLTNRERQLAPEELTSSSNLILRVQRRSEMTGRNAAFSTVNEWPVRAVRVDRQAHATSLANLGPRKRHKCARIPGQL